jgi:hypothetical protein
MDYSIPGAAINCESSNDCVTLLFYNVGIMIMIYC